MARVIVGQIFDHPMQGTVPCDGRAYLVGAYNEAYRVLGHKHGRAPAGQFRVPSVPGSYIVITPPPELPDEPVRNLALRRRPIPHRRRIRRQDDLDWMVKSYDV